MTIIVQGGHHPPGFLPVASNLNVLDSVARNSLDEDFSLPPHMTPAWAARRRTLLPEPRFVYRGPDIGPRSVLRSAWSAIPPIFARGEPLDRPAPCGLRNENPDGHCQESLPDRLITSN
jgi:hypothetical protein